MDGRREAEGKSTDSCRSSDVWRSTLKRKRNVSITFSGQWTVVHIGIGVMIVSSESGSPKFRVCCALRNESD